jgi:hypothetical protein
MFKDKNEARAFLYQQIDKKQHRLRGLESQQEAIFQQVCAAKVEYCSTPWWRWIARMRIEAKILEYELRQASLREKIDTQYSYLIAEMDNMQAIVELPNAEGFIVDL